MLDGGLNYLAESGTYICFQEEIQARIIGAQHENSKAKLPQAFLKVTSMSNYAYGTRWDCDDEDSCWWEFDNGMI
jgi:hypothetical protein